jgi:hypothetical protein
MMNHRLFLAAGLLAALTLSAATAGALEKPKPLLPAAGEKAPEPGKAPAADKSAAPSRPLPFHGKVTAIDPAGKSFSLNGRDKDRVFAVTDKTVVVGKDNSPAKLSAIPLGEEVRGSAIKAGDKWTAQKVYIGAKEATAGKGKEKK